MKGIVPQIILGILIVAAVVALGWASLPRNLETVKAWAPIAAPFLTVISLATALFVVYVSWLTPFSPSVIARPFVWCMGPVTPSTKSFELVFWTTVSNDGARPGSVDDLIVELVFPKGRWLLQPIAFVKSEDYFLINFGKQFQFPPVEGPFTPLFLAGRSQVTRAVLFMPMTSEPKDFDPSFAEAGVHEVRLYARPHGDRFEVVSVQKIVMEADLLSAWKSGQTIGGMVNHRDTDVRKLLPNAI